jgi:hypothetical protein
MKTASDNGFSGDVLEWRALDESERADVMRRPPLARSDE